MEKYISHHGLLLKNYIKEQGVNKKGGLNQLIEALGITRQGIYVLYEQREIKKKYRDSILEHLNLPDNFFPKAETKEEAFSQTVIDLQNKLINTQKELIQAERKMKQLAYSPKFFPVVVDSQNKDKIALVPRKAVAGYVAKGMDAEYIASLQTFSLPNFHSGFAFEIEGNSMHPSNIHDKDFVICDELVENIEEVNAKRPYVIILKTEEMVCKLIKPNQDTLKLISTNKEYQPYSIKLSEVYQIWKVKGKYTPDISLYS